MSEEDKELELAGNARQLTLPLTYINTSYYPQFFYSLSPTNQRILEVYLANRKLPIKDLCKKAKVSTSTWHLFFKKHGKSLGKEMKGMMKEKLAVPEMFNLVDIAFETAKLPVKGRADRHFLLTLAEKTGLFGDKDQEGDFDIRVQVFKKKEVDSS